MPPRPAATDRAPRLQTLPEIERALWRELERAVHDREHAWRTPVLATGGCDEVDARIVVLREAYPEHRELLIYTDARSPKMAQIQARPQGVMVMWHPGLGWQLRCRVRIEPEVSGLAVSSRWAQLQLTPAAQDYLSPLPPGAALDEAPSQPPAAPSRELPPRHHFAILSAQVEAIDWLELHPEGPRRAAFDAQGARWLQP
ncbi:pyridoxamine 5'-phosphate oxidase [Caldimonas tepidiphila]|uniref:pyridoxamine 5'-phosphate oxidase n=1 Tax=Caldimonas tepidiphila TaxID=2315841 RepID=UPI000E5A5662|nr:pyridoxamine 5'-phosphate oxidase [Caldimonas tepidiphila]